MADGPVTWTVGTQVHLSKFDEAGQAVPGVNIPVKLSTGEVFDVFVPATVYGPDAALEAITAAVNDHVAVARLTGTA